MTIRIIVAGATGWTGSAVAKAVLAVDDFVLTGAVARSGRPVATSARHWAVVLSV